MGRAREFLTALSKDSAREGLLALNFKEISRNVFLMVVSSPIPREYCVTKQGPGHWRYRVVNLSGGPAESRVIFTKEGSSQEILAAVEKHRILDWNHNLA